MKIVSFRAAIMADNNDEIALEDSDEETSQTKAPEKSSAEAIKEARIKRLQELKLRKVCVRPNPRVYTLSWWRRRQSLC